MQVVTYSNARSQLKNIIEQVAEHHEEYVLTRKNGKPVVMISLDEWNSIQETLHLLSSPRNAGRLRDSIAELEAGKGTEQSLLEP